MWASIKELVSQIALLYWGEQTNALMALHVCVIVEIVTLLMRVFSEKRWRRYINSKKVFQLMAIYILIGIANVIETYLIVGNSTIRDTTIGFYIAHEVGQILNNLLSCMPKVITDFFSALTNKLNR